MRTEINIEEARSGVVDVRRRRLELMKSVGIDMNLLGT
jgi:hypothetical protein